MLEQRKTGVFRIGRRPSKGRRKLVYGMVIAVVGLAGLVGLRLGLAATFTGTSEAEVGRLAGAAATASGASGSSIVHFGAGPTGGTALLQPYSLGLAPYAFVPYGNVIMSDYGAATGVKNFFAAFVLGAGCTPAWDGSASIGMASSRAQIIKQDIAAVRSQGGDVAVSFGGETGTELADACTSTSQLQAAYQTVIDTYAFTHLNFDIEGPSATNNAGLARRVQAVTALQRANPNLKISLTLAADPNGMTATQLNIVKAFRDAGVKLAGVHIMAMVFGAASGTESGRVISAAQAAAGQLQQLYAGLSAAEAYKALGVIVLLGDNTGGEYFTTADAAALRSFAVQQGVGTLSYWSANRDRPCDGVYSPGDNECSGVSQTLYQFAKLLLIPTI